jgi:hypothetical protein
MPPIPTAIITGAHPFDVINFHHLCRALPNIDPYLQHIEDFTAAAPEIRASYNVLIFYTHVRDHTATNIFLDTEKLHSMADQLGTSPQGIIVLHHGLVAFPDWPLWDDLAGLTNRTLDSYSHDELIPVQIADSDHPITAGLQNWTLTDETYLMNDPTPENGNHILLTTDHPQSMNALAWTRQYKQSRVVCIQSGHGNTAWSDSNFRQLLSQAIDWCSAK